jgi:CheY-like chemotaxis protein
MKNILSIDDEPELLRCFAEALKLRGYGITTTTDPEAGIRMLRDGAEVDLLLLDVKMPVKSGFEVYREVREFRPVPVLFVTAYPHSFTADSDAVHRMWQEQFSDGMTDIIYKPFDLDTFFSKIEGLIGGPDDPTESCDDRHD